MSGREKGRKGWRHREAGRDTPCGTGGQMGKVIDEDRDTEQGPLVLESSRMEVMVGRGPYMAIGPG